MSLREEPGYAAGLQYWCRDVRCANRGQHRGCYLGASAVSTITASAYRIAVTVALQTQSGGTTKARRSRALLLLLIAHAQFAARPERNARELPKRLREAAVFVAWLIEQTATVERVRHRAKRRRDLLARLIQPGSGRGVIRPRGGTSGKGGGRADDRCKSHNPRSWDQPSTTSSRPQGKQPSPFPQPSIGGQGCGAGQGGCPAVTKGDRRTCSDCATIWLKSALVTISRNRYSISIWRRIRRPVRGRVISRCGGPLDDGVDRSGSGGCTDGRVRDSGPGCPVRLASSCNSLLPARRLRRHHSGDADLSGYAGRGRPRLPDLLRTRPPWRGPGRFLRTEPARPGTAASAPTDGGRRASRALFLFPVPRTTGGLRLPPPD
jgi:hypothetical protein